MSAGSHAPLILLSWSPVCRAAPRCAEPGRPARAARPLRRQGHADRRGLQLHQRILYCRFCKNTQLHPIRSASSSSSSDDDDEEEEVEKTVADVVRIKGLRRAHQDKLDAGKAWADRRAELTDERRRRRWRGCWAVEAGTGAHSQVSGVAEHPGLHLLRTLLERVRERRVAAARVRRCGRPRERRAERCDAGLRTWWEGVGAYMRKVLLRAGYIIEPACTSRAQELQDQGRGFYQDRYKGHFDKLSMLPLLFRVLVCRIIVSANALGGKPLT
ncbi:hypothetical protein FB451DRAFT_1404234 [Mycena latifolia]|nr:hypothetical protein FB451DRAFT_1404234 [Mycena latifolia]